LRMDWELGVIVSAVPDVRSALVRVLGVREDFAIPLDLGFGFGSIWVGFDFIGEPWTNRVTWFRTLSWKAAPVRSQDTSVDVINERFKFIDLLTFQVSDADACSSFLPSHSWGV
jgi:hypothetical protein